MSLEFLPHFFLKCAAYRGGIYKYFNVYSEIIYGSAMRNNKKGAKAIDVKKREE
jgi:hypothetical protein